MKLPKMNIRKRLIVFGMIWLTICSVALASLLVWHTQTALLIGAAEKSETIAHKLVNASKANIFSGDTEEIKKEIDKIVLGDIIGASLKFDGLLFGNNISKEKAKDLTTSIGANSSLILVNGMRVIKTEIMVSQPGQQTISVSIFLNAENIYEQAKSILWLGYLFLIPMLISFLIIAWILSGKIVSPLQRLSAHIIGKKQLKQDQALLGHEKKDEIDLIFEYCIELEDKLNKKAVAFETVDEKHKAQLRETTESFEGKNIQLANTLESHKKLLLLLSHEVRTPMTALSLHITNLFDSLDLDLTDKQANRVERIKSLAQRIFRLMESVLKFSLQEATHSEVPRVSVDLSNVSKQVIFSLNHLIRGMDVECLIDASVHNKYVFINPDHLEQILLNLVHNSIKQSPPGSKIILSANETDGFIQFSVEDSGLGIDASIKDKIFKGPLKTTYQESNGVGLYICRYLVELHNGSIWFEDNPKQGTTFIFSLPKSDPVNIFSG